MSPNPQAIINANQLIKAIAAGDPQIVIWPGEYLVRNQGGADTIVKISKRVFLATGASVVALASNANAWLPSSGGGGGGSISLTAVNGPVISANVGNDTAWAAVAASGVAPYTFSISSGPLPPGWVLDPYVNNPSYPPPPNTNPDHVAIHGVLTTAGTYSFTIQVEDSLGAIGTLSSSITVGAKVYPTGVVNLGIQSVYDQRFTAGPASPPTLDPIINAGSLPSGWVTGTETTNGVVYKTLTGTSPATLTGWNLKGYEVHNKVNGVVAFSGCAFGYPNGIKSYWQGEGGTTSTTTMTNCSDNGIGMCGGDYPWEIQGTGTLTLTNHQFIASTPNQLVWLGSGTLTINGGYIGACNIGANITNHGEMLNIRAGTLVLNNPCIDCSASGLFAGGGGEPAYTSPIWPNSLNGGVTVTGSGGLIMGTQANTCFYTVRATNAGHTPNAITITGFAIEQGSAGGGTGYFLVTGSPAPTLTESGNVDLITGAAIP